MMFLTPSITQNMEDNMIFNHQTFGGEIIRCGVSPGGELLFPNVWEVNKGIRGIMRGKYLYMVMGGTHFLGTGLDRGRTTP